ncbi:MAG: futalosine hydrolase [Planctomycetota bacterium]
MVSDATADWLVLYATAGEGAQVQAALRQPRARTLAGLRFLAGWLPADRQATRRRSSRRVRLILAATGVGLANAAYAAGVGLAAFRVRGVASIGIAGGYARDCWPIGAVACGRWFGLGDAGVREGADRPAGPASNGVVRTARKNRAGWRDLGAIGIPLAGAVASGESFNRLPARVAVTHRMLAALPSKLRPAGVLTVNACSGAPDRAAELRRRAGKMAPGFARLPWVEDMETAGIALACLRADRPLLSLRGISNCAGDRDRRHWDIPGAAAAAQQALLTIVTAARESRHG